MTDRNFIRNFCIVAHIDHGKSTLADRLLEKTGLVERTQREQVLDSMDLERERGITIKASAVQLKYLAQDGHTYQLNLIDTPGHVDFSYEVSRALAACEGALLVVDAVQGVEAQTVANAHLAIGANLEIVPVINKTDLPTADVARVGQELEQVIGISADDAIAVSAKEGTNVEQLLEAIVQRIPPPSGDPEAPLRALIFDSHYDSYRGIVCYVRVVEGTLTPGQRIKFHITGREFEVSEVGIFELQPRGTEALSAGEVGYVTANIKSIGDARVGDTITDARRPAEKPLPGYRDVKPMVFCGFYPTQGADFNVLRESLERLQLNDAALRFEPEKSALGLGMRCGFLGLLHMDIVQERLSREENLELLATAPSVVYRVTLRSGEVLEIENPSEMPDPGQLERVEEPYLRATLISPANFVGPCIELCEERRGIQIALDYVSPQRVVLTYELPLAEVLLDFFDQLKSRTRGYASLDYEFAGFREGKLVKVSVMLNGEVTEALSFICPRDRSYKRGKALVERLRKMVPRQQFEVRIQAAIGGKIIASERIAPFRKEVLSKCSGGDITRKRKLLEKQREGKSKMRQLGKVELPQEAFLEVLRVGE